MHEREKSTIAIRRPKTVMQHNILELKLWALLEVENKGIRGSLWKYRQSSVFKFQFLHFFECYAQKKIIKESGGTQTHLQNSICIQ